MDRYTELMRWSTYYKSPPPNIEQLQPRNAPYRLAYYLFDLIDLSDTAPKLIPVLSIYVTRVKVRDNVSLVTTFSSYIYGEGDMARIVIVYHSGFGHTKIQAEHVLKGTLAVTGIVSELITSDEAIKDFEPLNKADCIVFGCPTYMGGPSAQFKSFIDAASPIWAKQGWKDKLAAGFTNSSGPSGDKLSTLTHLMVNAMQHSMIWISQGLMPGSKDGKYTLNRLSSFSGAMSQSPHGSTEPIADDLMTAEMFGTRVAEITLRWNKEK
jgi:multimeric flavodoxin WrbA